MAVDVKIEIDQQENDPKTKLLVTQEGKIIEVDEKLAGKALKNLEISDRYDVSGKNNISVPKFPNNEKPNPEIISNQLQPEYQHETSGAGGGNIQTPNARTDVSPSGKEPGKDTDVKSFAVKGLLPSGSSKSGFIENIEFEMVSTAPEAKIKESKGQTSVDPKDYIKFEEIKTGNENKQTQTEAKISGGNKNTDTDVATPVHTEQKQIEGKATLALPESKSKFSDVEGDEKGTLPTTKLRSSQSTYLAPDNQFNDKGKKISDDGIEIISKREQDLIAAHAAQMDKLKSDMTDAFKQSLKDLNMNNADQIDALTKAFNKNLEGKDAQLKDLKGQIDSLKELLEKSNEERVDSGKVTKQNTLNSSPMQTVGAVILGVVADLVLDTNMSKQVLSAMVMGKMIGASTKDILGMQLGFGALGNFGKMGGTEK